MLIQDNPRALSLFLTEPVYLVKEEVFNLKVKETEENPVEVAANASTPAPIIYEGKNLKKVLLLYKGADKQLPSAQRDFLGKILQSVNLNFEDIALVNTHILSTEQFPLLNKMEAKVWLSFGVTHEALDIKENTPYYKIIKTENTSLLLANALEEIETDRDKKVLLWNNLKSLFNI